MAHTGPFRLALTALALLTPAAALFAALIGTEVNQALASRTLEMLRGELQTFRAELDRGGIAALTAAVAARSTDAGPGLYRLDLDGSSLLPIAGNLKNIPDGVGPSGSVFNVWNLADDRFHAAAGLVVPIPGGGRLLVARDIEDQRLFAETLQRTAFAGIAALSLIALGIGWLASRRTMNRLAGVTTTTRAIMAGDLTQRLPQDRSGDEFDQLGTSVNAMLARIEDLMQSLREVSDNIAHDLKTPLTRLRNRAEAALRDDRPSAQRDGLEKVIEESDGLIQTFNALLLIARLEAGVIDQTRTDCDLTALVADVAELYQPVADEAGLAIVLDMPGPAHLLVNRQLVGQAVANIIDNAIKYSAGTPSAGAGPITVKVTPVSAVSVEISVADHGPGIPSADRNRAVKRFVRLEQSRSRPGTGLGLSLVAAVARLHGGSVRLEDNAPGLRIVLVLNQPLARPPLAAPPGHSDRAADLATAAG